MSSVGCVRNVVEGVGKECDRGECGLCRPGAGAESDDGRWVLLVHAVPVPF